MTTKREAEEQPKSETSAKNRKLNMKEYVSKNNGSIDRLYENRKLICFLYEQKCDLIEVSDINGTLSNIAGIDKFYCYVQYRSFISKENCYSCSESVYKKYGKPEWLYLDTINQNIFNFNIAKCDTQNNSKQWAFATSPLVIKYVKIMKPLDLVISTVTDDKKIVTFMQGNTVICLKIEKESKPFQLC
uniref:Uncharacterized protein n=1 Tax=Pithovirus LCPAC404 TaxID=2506597 RepID=A0A481ZC13_9VIRU|nr:MAG: uncharacterized protein LCPAC404_01580 [Pithovirus LCPAC404]